MLAAGVNGKLCQRQILLGDQEHGVLRRPVGQLPGQADRLNGQRTPPSRKIYPHCRSSPRSPSTKRRGRARSSLDRHTRSSTLGAAAWRAALPPAGKKLRSPDGTPRAAWRLRSGGPHRRRGRKLPSRRSLSRLVLRGSSPRPCGPSGRGPNHPEDRRGQPDRGPARAVSGPARRSGQAPRPAGAGTFPLGNHSHR